VGKSISAVKCNGYGRKQSKCTENSDGEVDEKQENRELAGFIV
jgi:hypothetical protein